MESKINSSELKDQSVGGMVLSPNGKYKAAVTKSMLFGYEADLKLDSYAVLNSKRGQNATAERFEDAMWFPTLTAALTEAQLCVVEQGRKQDMFIVYAVRRNRMLQVEAWESMACCEKYPVDRRKHGLRDGVTSPKEREHHATPTSTVRPISAQCGDRTGPPVPRSGIAPILAR